MTKVLYIWEFGGGLGHLSRGLPLARAYRRDGHDVGFVVKDMAAARVLIPEGEFAVRQAPACAPAARLVGHRPISYAEILLQCGLGDPGRLGAVARAWLDLFRQAHPDLLVLDFAPTAMLAARVAGIRHCTVGHGFFLPPKLTPVPAFADHADPQRLARSEALLVNSVNQVLAQHSRPALHSLAEFFDAELDLLTTWPEIEHYPQRQGATYWGPIMVRDEGKAPDWPAEAGPKLFAYLQGQDHRSIPILETIAATGSTALAYVPGLKPEAVKRFNAGRIAVSSSPYAVNQAAAEVSAVICHAGFGTVWEALLAGTPLLCVPLHREQQIVAQQLEQLGVAITLDAKPSGQDIAQALRRLTHEPAFRQNAQQIAAKYRAHDQEARLSQMVAASLSAGSAGNS